MANLSPNTLVFKNGGVFEPAMPTINCRTCKARRMKRLMAASLPHDEDCGGLVYVFFCFEFMFK